MNEEKLSIYNFISPYILAINKLKEIPRLKSPVHKLKVITKSVELVHKCIRDFYKVNSIDVDVNLTADEIL